MALVLTGLVRASLIGTFSGVGTADDTISVGGKTYTLKASTTTGDGEVKIGATAAATCTNFCLAVNAGPTGSGTLWGSATPANAYATAVDNGDGTVTIKARSSGVAGNLIVLAESGTGFSWAGAATALASGAGAFETLVLAQLNVLKLTHQINAQTTGLIERMILDLS